VVRFVVRASGILIRLKPSIRRKGSNGLSPLERGLGRKVGRAGKRPARANSGGLVDKFETH